MTPDMTAWRGGLDRFFDAVVSVYIPYHIRCSRTPSSTSGTSGTDRVEEEQQQRQEEEEEEEQQQQQQHKEQEQQLR